MVPEEGVRCRRALDEEGQGRWLRRLPNALSLARILLALSLLLLPKAPVAFGTAYLLCGLTDVADGFLARRLEVESELGARLHSLGDLVFWAAVLLLFFVLAPVEIPALAGWGVLGVAAVRCANALLTRLKFHRWGMLHTWGNKAAGLLLYVAAPLSILLGHIPAAVLPPLLLVCLGSALEETGILLLRPDYLPDRRGLWDKWK